jgi:hypothetical protein
VESETKVERSQCQFFLKFYRQKIMDGDPIHSIPLSCHVPIAMNSFELRHGVMMKKIPGLSEEQNMEVARAYVKQARPSAKTW